MMRSLDATLWSLRVVVALFVLFMVAPIFVVVVISFTSAGYVGFPMPGLSLRWFAQVANYPPFLSGIRVSIEVAAGATILSCLLGIPAALTLARSERRAAQIVMAYLLSPLSIPMIVLGFAAPFYLSRLGFGISLAALMVVHASVCLPYIVRIVASVYRTLPQNLEEAAEVLGAPGWRVLAHVVLPLLRPAILAGSLFSFLVSFDNLPLSYFFGSGTTNTLPVIMLAYVEQQFDPSIASLSTLQLVVAVVLLVVVDRTYGLETLTIST